MPSRTAYTARRSDARERGAVIVETAIVLPILFTLIFAVMEIGGAIKTYSSAANAVRAGGRMASVAGNDAMADQMILERVAQEAAGMGKDEILYIVVWRADAPGSGGTAQGVPASCVHSVPAMPNAVSAGSHSLGTGACNIYFLPGAPGGAFDMARGELAQEPSYYFGCTGPGDPDAPHKVDCNFPGKDRRIARSPRGETPVLRPDHVGVHIRATHTYYTGILGDELTVDESGVNLLEPQNYALASP